MFPSILGHVLAFGQGIPGFVCTFSAPELESTIFQVALFPLGREWYLETTIWVLGFSLLPGPLLLTLVKNWSWLFYLSTPSLPHPHFLFPFLWHQFLDETSEARKTSSCEHTWYNIWRETTSSFFFPQCVPIKLRGLQLSYFKDYL